MQLISGVLIRKIVILGSLNIDIRVRRPEDRTGLMGDGVACGMGGKGANMAVAAHRLGAEVELHSKVGDDLFGRVLIEHLADEGIGTSGIRIGKGIGSCLSLLIIDRDGGYTNTRGGVGYKSMSKGEVDAIKLDGSEIAISALSFPPRRILDFFRKAKRKGCTTVLNCGPKVKAGKELLGLSDYLIMNDAEFAFHLGLGRMKIDAGRVESLAARIRRAGQVLIVTMGRRGFVAISDEGTVVEDGHKVSAVDTTGAGDSFIGAFAACVSKGKGLRESLEFANAAAAISVQRHGAAGSMPKDKEVRAFLEKRGI